MKTEPEAWQRVCRDGWLPLLSDAQLAGLREALAADDERLVQQATCVGVAVARNDRAVRPKDFRVQQACPVAFAEWQGACLDSTEDVVNAFAGTCGAIDARLGEKGGCRHLFHYWDCTHRAEAIAGLLGEVRREQQRRAAPCP